MKMMKAKEGAGIVQCAERMLGGEGELSERC
jgi:hypothetical protein